MAILDASVIVAMFDARDPRHSAAIAWYAAVRASRGRLIAPPILVAEVAGAIARSLGEPDRAAAVLQTLMDRRVVTLTPLSAKTGISAAQVAIAHRLRGCDAVYVALAEELDDILVTFDREQYERAQGAVRVLWPGRDG